MRRHIAQLLDEDVVELAGVHCTSLSRTLVDLARAPNHERGLAAVDAGLRNMFPSERGEIPDAVDGWRDGASEALGGMTGRGTRSALKIIDMADPRADSPAESVSRLHLIRLGIDIDVQVPILVDGRARYWADFEFLGKDVFGEVDGRVKYLNQKMRGAATAEQVVLAEKAREDEIRGISGKRIVRWHVEHLRSARTLGERLQRFGIDVPALGAEA